MTQVEDRLRVALAARAARITPGDLRPAAPPRARRQVSWLWVPVLGAAAVLIAVILQWQAPAAEMPAEPPVAPTQSPSSSPAPQATWTITPR